LVEAGIKHECVEYIKGETHYIVLVIKTQTLLSFGAPSGVELGFIKVESPGSSPMFVAC